MFVLTNEWPVTKEFNIDNKKIAVSFSEEILTTVFLKGESNLTGHTMTFHIMEHSEVLT